MTLLRDGYSCSIQCLASLCSQYRIANWLTIPRAATGGSAIKAIEVLLEQGVLEERIIFLNLIASPEGLDNICNRFRKAKVISAWVDEKLDDQKYIRMFTEYTNRSRC